MAPKSKPARQRIQFFMGGYTLWALEGYAATRAWGRNRVVEWIVEQWLEQNQARLRDHSLAESNYAASLPRQA